MGSTVLQFSLVHTLIIRGHTPSHCYNNLCWSHWWRVQHNCTLFCNVSHGPAFIAFLCSPPLPLSSGCMYEPFCQIMGVTSNSYLCKQRYWIFWYIVNTYLWGSPPCTYCPNLSSKLDRLNPKKPSYSLPFLYYELVTDHFFRNGSNFPISGCYASTLPLNSERVFCNQLVMEEWQNVRRLFGVKTAFLTGSMTTWRYILIQSLTNPNLNLTFWINMYLLFVIYGSELKTHTNDHSLTILEPFTSGLTINTMDHPFLFYATFMLFFCATIY